MVKLNQIYTKTGDDGTTGLVRGPRRQKFDLRIEAYGTVDEANSFIGQARLHTISMPKIDMLLSRNHHQKLWLQMVRLFLLETITVIICKTYQGKSRSRNICIILITF